MKIMIRGLLLLLAVSVISCVTINIYFPAEELRGAADKIVNDVWGTTGSETKETKPQDQNKNPGSSFYRLFLPTDATAGQDVNVSTPAIRAIKDSMKNRSAALIGFLNAGNIGLRSDGLLKIYDTQGLTLKQKGQLNKLVRAENRDRQNLYHEIAIANNFPDKVSEVQMIFADSWRNQAQSGWYLENPDGSWIQK